MESDCQGQTSTGCSLCGAVLEFGVVLSSTHSVVVDMMVVLAAGLFQRGLIAQHSRLQGVCLLYFSILCVCARDTFGSLVMFVHQGHHTSKLSAAASLPAVRSNTMSQTSPPSFVWVCLRSIQAPAPFLGLGICMASNGQLCPFGHVGGHICALCGWPGCFVGCCRFDHIV
jgi:hypothetical protein